MLAKSFLLRQVMLIANSIINKLENHVKEQRIFDGK